MTDDLDALAQALHDSQCPHQHAFIECLYFQYRRSAVAALAYLRAAGWVSRDERLAELNLVQDRLGMAQIALTRAEAEVARLREVADACDEFGRITMARILLPKDGQCAGCGREVPPSIHTPSCWLRPLMQRVRLAYEALHLVEHAGTWITREDAKRISEDGP